MGGSNYFRTLYTEANSIELLTKSIKELLGEYDRENRTLIILCVGTDRSTGDSLGPWVGTKLIKTLPNTAIYGTLDNPVHAVNLVDTLESIKNNHFNPFIIAVDACLGQLSNVGSIQLSRGPVKPGAGVNKDLPPVGDISLCGIVNVGGFMEYFVLQNTRLSLVVNIADVISKSIEDAINQLSIPKRKYTKKNKI